MRCEECGGVLTQPLGSERVGEQVAAWLREKCPERDDVFDELATLVEEIPITRSDTWCLKTCQPMSTCLHCTTKRIYVWIAQTLPEHSAEFLDIFTFTEERPEFLAIPLRVKVTG